MIIVLIQLIGFPDYPFPFSDDILVPGLCYILFGLKLSRRYLILRATMYHGNNLTGVPRVL